MIGFQAAYPVFFAVSGFEKASGFFIERSQLKFFPVVKDQVIVIRLGFGTHADIDDVDQTIKFPDIKTTLRGEDDVVRVDEDFEVESTEFDFNLFDVNLI